MPDQSFTKVTYELDQNVALIRLNDTATLNAMSATMGQELRAALDRAQTEARAIFLGSHGRAFCSGANLAEGGFSLDNPSHDGGARLETIFNPLIIAMRDSAIPIVIGVRGAAAGVGCGIALTGDVIVAGESGYFYQAFRHVGLVPDGGSSYLLARAIGRVRAMEMMLLGEKLPAAKALDWGLITRVVPDDQLEDVAIGFARQLATGPRSLGLIRKEAWAALDSPLEEQLHCERTLQREAGRSKDFIEGVLAFREKRAPKFKGE